MNELTVATFNIRYGRGIDDRIDLGRTSAAIAACGASIVALQELDRDQERSGHVDQPAALAELTGLHVTFFPQIVSEAGEYGIALATSAPLEAEFVALPRFRNEEPRGVIAAEGYGLTVLATHIATRPPARTLHLRALGDIVGDARPPVLLLGDLNAGPRALGPLRDAGMSGGPRVATTMTRRKRRIDWILVTPPARLVSARTVMTDASDHLPLAGTIETG